MGARQVMLAAHARKAEATAKVIIPKVDTNTPGDPNPCKKEMTAAQWQQHTRSCR